MQTRNLQSAGKHVHLANRLPLSVFLIILCWLVPRLLIAQQLLWAGAMGAGGVDAALSVKPDVSGNVYTTGIFNNTVDFDPGAGISELTSAGMEDIFIVKCDAAGNFLWAKAIGGANPDYGTSVSIDASGNIILTGQFLGTVDFDPGPGIFNMSSIGSLNTFVCKLDSSGNFIWAKSMGGTFQNSANSISADASGNIYIAGSFFETVDFDPGPGIFNLTSAGGQDIYIAKIDPSGNFVWAKTMGGQGDDFPVAVSLDGSGNIHTTGAFSETADFDPGPGDFNLTSAGVEDIYVCKLDNSGNFIWARSFGSESFDEGQAITTDAAGNVLITGFFSGSVDFDPGTGMCVLSTPGDTHDYDIYILKLNASGNFIWVKSMFATRFNEGRSIAVDPSGKVFSTGTYQGTSDFDPGAGNYTLTPTGSEEMYLSVLDAEGNFLWAGAMAGNSAGTSLALDDSGLLHATGYFGTGSCDFDPGSGTFNLPCQGMTDIFIAKYHPVLTGLEPMNNTNRLSVNPNPTNGRLNISTKEISGKVVLYNLMGEVVEEFDSQVSSGGGVLSVNISNHPDGIYLIRANAQDYNFIKKIVLQK